MLAWKTLNEHKRNQEKIRKFCLEKAKQQKTAANPQPVEETKQQKINTRNLRTGKKVTNWSPDKVQKVASQNQTRQQRTETPITPKSQPTG